MVLSMGTTNTLYLPYRINTAMRFNFNTIFYVQYRSEEISPSSVFPRVHGTFVALLLTVAGDSRRSQAQIAPVQGVTEANIVGAVEAVVGA